MGLPHGSIASTAPRVVRMCACACAHEVAQQHEAARHDAEHTWRQRETHHGVTRRAGGGRLPRAGLVPPRALHVGLHVVLEQLGRHGLRAGNCSTKHHCPLPNAVQVPAPTLPILDFQESPRRESRTRVAGACAHTEVVVAVVVAVLVAVAVAMAVLVPVLVLVLVPVPVPVPVLVLVLVLAHPRRWSRAAVSAARPTWTPRRPLCRQSPPPAAAVCTRRASESARPTLRICRRKKILAPFGPMPGIVWHRSTLFGIGPNGARMFPREETSEREAVRSARLFGEEGGGEAGEALCSPVASGRAHARQPLAHAHRALRHVHGAGGRLRRRGREVQQTHGLQTCVCGAGTAGHAGGQERSRKHGAAKNPAPAAVRGRVWGGGGRHAPAPVPPCPAQLAAAAACWRPCSR